MTMEVRIGDEVDRRRTLPARADLRAFEQAEAEEDDAHRAQLMTFVVVGGGPTGVEMAGQLKELSAACPAAHSSADPSRIDPRRANRGHRPPGCDNGQSAIADYCERPFEVGVELHLGAVVTDMDDYGVDIKQPDGNTVRIDAATRVWAAGTEGSPIGTELSRSTGVELDRAGRVTVEPDCTVPGYPDIFVVGDLMALDDLPGVAEVAMQSGAHAAHTIARRCEGQRRRAPVPLLRPRDAGGDLTLSCCCEGRANQDRRPSRMAAVAGRPHYLSHGVQEPDRCVGPLGRELHWAGTLRACADRGLGERLGAIVTPSDVTRALFLS